MAQANFGQKLAADTLAYLADQRAEPMLIDEAALRGEFSPHDIVMTSMGTRNKAVITPYYSAIQFESTLKQRLQWARVLERPFVEAAVGMSRTRRAASLAVRYCADPLDAETCAVIESRWLYPLPEAAALTNTTDQVIEAIVDNAFTGEPVQAGSGLVVITNESLKSSSWSLSYKTDPNEAIEGLRTQINALAFTNPA